MLISRTLLVERLTSAPLPYGYTPADGEALLAWFDSEYSESNHQPIYSQAVFRLHTGRDMCQPNLALLLVAIIGSDNTFSEYQDFEGESEHYFFSGSFCALNSIDIPGDLIVAGELICHADIYVGGSLHVFGALQVNGTVVASKCINCHQGVTVNEDVLVERGSLLSHDTIAVGRNLSVDQSIKTTHGAIIAGQSIFTHGQVEVDDNFGIYAGLKVPIASWPVDGFVRCKGRPSHLRAGHYLSDF